MDLNELKDKLLSTLGQAGEVTRGIAGTAADKAKSAARLAKLTTEAATARDDLKKTYLELGKLYYDIHRDDAEGFFAQLVEEVRLAQEAVEQKEEEIEALKASLKEGFSESSADFETVVDQEESGAVMDTILEKAETVKDTIKDAVEDGTTAVKEKVNELVEDVKDKASEVKEKAEEKTAEVKEKVAEKLEEVQDTLADKVEAAQEAAEQAKSDSDDDT